MTSTIFVVTKEPITDTLFAACVKAVSHIEAREIAQKLRDQINTFWLATNEFYAYREMYSPKFTAAQRQIENIFQMNVRAGYPQSSIQTVEELSRLSVTEIYGAMLEVIMPD